MAALTTSGSHFTIIRSIYQANIKRIPGFYTKELSSIPIIFNLKTSSGNKTTKSLFSYTLVHLDVKHIEFSVPVRMSVNNIGAKKSNDNTQSALQRTGYTYNQDVVC